MEPNILTRLERVAGEQTTTLTHYGRNTGKPHEVSIWFVLDGEKLYIGTAIVNRQWVRSVQKTPKIKLSIGGEMFDGNARFLTDRAEHERPTAAISTEVQDVWTRYCASIRVSWSVRKPKLRVQPITESNMVKSVIKKFREKYAAKDVKKYYSKFEVAVLVRLG